VWGCSKRNKRDWLAIGTTDLSLSPQQVVSLYARRWNIEVFFKTIKSCLGFARECQCRSFDAIVCSVAVVFTRLPFYFNLLQAVA
jgi:IS4 transposase